MKKTALALILIIIIGALFSACGNKTTTSEATETTTTSSTESTTIIIETEKKEPAEMWEIDWDDTILGPNGFEYELPDGWFEKVCYDETCCILLEGYERELYKLTTDGKFIKLSEKQKVIDYTVAYDTLYWFNLDSEVWSLSWAHEDVAKLYCEDAIAVSPFADECEGAVVSPERANWFGYGDLPIYSPYGE